MKSMVNGGVTGIVVLGLEPGDLLLESIRKAIRKHRIRDGAIVSGIGTLKNCRLHYIEGIDFPPQNQFFMVAKPLELLSVSGTIADREPHVHVVISRGETEVFAGHLEDGSEVAYLAEIAILKFGGVPMTRQWDPVRQIGILGPRRRR